MRIPLLALPIFLTLLVSGCTIPGIPCIPGLTCGQTVEETHDVIVIESLQALPNNVPPDGTIKLVAIITNVADVDAEITKLDNIQVELYDYCEGLFQLTGSSGGTQSNDKKTLSINLLRGEKKQVEWTLKALPRDRVPVKTECTLKIRAKYPYATRSITTLHLIDYVEMQRRINEGTYKEITSYRSIGYGPIKPYLTVEGSQPIPVDEKNEINAVLTFQIVNRGKGFLSSPDDKPEPVIGWSSIKDNIKAVSTDDISTNIENKLKTCIQKYFDDNKREGDSEGRVKLIKGESTKMPCTISGIGGKVPVESTKTIEVSVGKIDNRKPVIPYWYEFRKEIKVTVEPKF